MMDAPAMSMDRAAALGPGRLVLVVGPSGAGKDMLLGLAKVACTGDGGIIFPRRVVTRSASSSEDNDQLTREAFGEGLAQGQFAQHW